MSLLNLLVKIGTDILTKPNSNTAQVTQYILRNPQVVRDGAELVGNLFKGLATVTFVFFSKTNAKKAVRTNYDNWNKSPDSHHKNLQKESFSKMSSFVRSRIKDETPLDFGLERDFAYRSRDFAYRSKENETVIGVYKDNRVVYAENVTYNSIEPEFDRELNRKQLVLLQNE
jgi:hypothetical protein